MDIDQTSSTFINSDTYTQMARQNPGNLFMTFNGYFKDII